MQRLRRREHEHVGVLVMVRQRRLLGSVALATMILGGCDRDAQQGANQQLQQGAADQAALDDGRNATFAQDSLRDWFIEFGLVGIPETETELLATVGVADSVLRIGAANVYDPVAFDTIIEAYYPGLVVSILKQAGSEALQSVWVSDTTFLIGPIRPGTDSVTLVNRLGPPMTRGRPGYVCRECSRPNAAAFFELVNGSVSGVLFTYPGG